METDFYTASCFLVFLACAIYTAGVLMMLPAAFALGVLSAQGKATESIQAALWPLWTWGRKEPSTRSADLDEPVEVEPLP